MVPAFRIVLIGPTEFRVAFVSPEAGAWIREEELGLWAKDRVHHEIDNRLVATLKPFTQSTGFQEEMVQQGVGITRFHPERDKAAYLVALVRSFESLAEANAYAEEHGYQLVGEFEGEVEPVLT